MQKSHSLPLVVKLIGALLLVIPLLANLLVTPAFASICTSQAAGNWSAPGTWSGCGAGVPGTGDSVVIANGNTVTLDTNATVSSLTVADGGTTTALSISGTNSLTVTNDVNIGTASANITKSVDVNSGTLIVGGNLNLFESTSSRYSQLNIGTGTATIAGNINYAANGTSTNARIVFSSTGTLNVAGTFPSTITLTTLTGSTVNFTGAAQTIPNYVYKGTLGLAGSGIKTLPTSFTTAPVNMTLSGTASATTAGNFSMTGNLLINSGTSLTVAPNYTFSVGGTTSLSGT